MSKPLSRRDLVRTAAASGAGLYLAAAPDLTSAARRARRRRVVRGGAFRHGVAAGAPGERDIMLWTRLSEVDRTSYVRLEVARDPDFRRVIERRKVRAVPWRDFTARARVSRRLRAGEDYFYRWETATAESPVGRFRVAPPPDSNEPVRIGFFSCQDYEAGYYTAHSGLAAEPDLDLIVCLGDYVYEAHFYPGPEDRRDTTGANGDGQVQTLSEYRDKYALYHSDPYLQGMRSSAPLLAIWDDHEVEDNWAGDHPGTTEPDDRRVDFAERKRVAQLAFFEWMPRLRMRQELMRIYGSLRLGRNVELFALDARSYRDAPPCGEGEGIPHPDHAALDLLVPCPDGESGERTLLGEAQKRWLLESVPASTATWKVLGNQVMAMALDSAPGQTLNVDQWDGYGRERREVFGALRAAGVENLTFITGDIHTFFAGTVHENGRITTPPIGTEFVGGSITSLGLEEYAGEGAAVTEQGVRANNPHLVYSDQRHRGYGVLEARRDELLVTFRSPESALTRTSSMRDLARFRVASGSTAVEQL